MKPIVILFCAFAVIFFAADQPAKDKKPDFTGAWSESSPPRGGNLQTQPDRTGLGSGWGKQFTIIQTADALVVERNFFTRGDFQPTLKYRYSLKGAETRNRILMGRGFQEQVSKTAWDDQKLVIKTIYNSQYPVDGRIVTCQVTQTLSLLISKNRPYAPFLVVETTRDGVLGGPPSKTLTVYSKNWVRR